MRVHWTMERFSLTCCCCCSFDVAIVIAACCSLARVPFGQLHSMMTCTHLCCDDVTFYCFAVGFAVMLIYCHGSCGSCQRSIDGCLAVKHDHRIVLIVEARCREAGFDV